MSRALEMLPEIGDAVIKFIRKEIREKYLSQYKEEKEIPAEDFNTLVICLLAGIVGNELQYLSHLNQINIDILVGSFNEVLKTVLEQSTEYLN